MIILNSRTVEQFEQDCYRLKDQLSIASTKAALTLLENEDDQILVLKCNYLPLTLSVTRPNIEDVLIKNLRVLQELEEYELCSKVEKALKQLK